MKNSKNKLLIIIGILVCLIIISLLVVMSINKSKTNMEEGKEVANTDIEEQVDESEIKDYTDILNKNLTYTQNSKLTNMDLINKENEYITSGKITITDEEQTIDTSKIGKFEYTFSVIVNNEEQSIVANYEIIAEEKKEEKKDKTENKVSNTSSNKSKSSSSSKSSSKSSNSSNKSKSSSSSSSNKSSSSSGKTLAEKEKIAEKFLAKEEGKYYTSKIGDKSLGDGITIYAAGYKLYWKYEKTGTTVNEKDEKVDEYEWIPKMIDERYGEMDAYAYPLEKYLSKPKRKGKPNEKSSSIWLYHYYTYRID